MGLILNIKGGIIPTFFLFLLVVGFGLGTGLGINIVAGNAHARTAFLGEAFHTINEMEKMRIFYEDAMDYAVEDSMENLGYWTDFCPKKVDILELREEIYKVGNTSVSIHDNLIGYPLPYLSDDDGEGTVNLVKSQTYIEVIGSSLKPLIVTGPGMQISAPGDFYYIKYMENTQGYTGADSDGDGLLDDQEDDIGSDELNKDSDNDGLPDGWEFRNCMDPTDTTDALLDFDADGLTNYDEYYRLNGDGVFVHTDIFDKDTDGDGHNDRPDWYPTDPTRYAVQIQVTPTQAQTVP